MAIGQPNSTLACPDEIVTAYTTTESEVPTARG
jgi:hypothetical protein